MLGWGPRDVAGFAIGAFATIAILSNVLFMQSGSHPAPMFKDAFVPPKPVNETGKGWARSDDEAGGSDGQCPGSRDGPAPAAGGSRVRPGAGQGHRPVRLTDAR